MARSLDMGLRIRFMSLAKEKNLPQVVTRPQLVAFSEENQIPFPQWLTMDKTLTVSRGVYRIPYDRFNMNDETTESPKKTETPLSTLSCSLVLSSPKLTSGSRNDRFERALQVAASLATPRPQKRHDPRTDE